MLQRVRVLQAAAQCVFELGHRRKQPIVGSPAALSTPAAALPSGKASAWRLLASVVSQRPCGWAATVSRPISFVTGKKLVTS